MGKNISDLDKVDRSILRHLQADGRQASAKLAESLSVSETACWRRLKRLEAEGYIVDYQANLNRRKLGFSVLAFVQLSFSSHTEQATALFEKTVLAHPQVLSCHNVSGRADYLLQIVAEDLDAYGRFIDNVLRKLPGMTAIESSLALRELKSSNRMPVP